MSSTGRAAYGPLADRVAATFEPDDPVVIFDQTGAAEALRDCASRRFRCETFFVRAILPRDYAVRVDAVVPSIVTSLQSLDERRAALEHAAAGTLQVNNKPLHSALVYTPQVKRLAQAAVRLADGLVVSSESERRRIQELLSTDPPVMRLDIEDPSVPHGGKRHIRQRDVIVIWAPHLTGDAAYGFAIALSELRIPCVIASADPPLEASLASWVPLEQAVQVLQRAALIVDTSEHGSESARRLASWGAPMICDVESGSHELLDGVRVYDRRRSYSIFEAAIAALGQAPPRVRSALSFSRLTVADESVNDGPLVSVIIPTLDRPAMLADALDSVMLQTYRNIQTIVVVDGGPRLDALSDKYPTAQFIHMPENNGRKSMNTAFAAAKGEYIAFLNDDDVFFPHHVASLVAALERSGCSVAHGDVLTAYLRGSGDEWLLYGLESNMSRAADFSAFLIANQIGMTSCMLRRSCITDGVLMPEAVPYYFDYALWLRLARDNDFVHVERITSCYTIRNKGAQQQSVMWSSQATEAYRAIYDLYPVTNRPMMQRRREERLQSMMRGETELVTEPAGQVQPLTWPMWDNVTAQARTAPSLHRK